MWENFSKNINIIVLPGLSHTWTDFFKLLFSYCFLLHIAYSTYGE